MILLHGLPSSNAVDLYSDGFLFRISAGTHAIMNGMFYGALANAGLHSKSNSCMIQPFSASCPETQQNSLSVSPFNVWCNVSANPGCDWSCHRSVHSSLALSASVIPPDNASGNASYVYYTEDIRRSLVEGSEKSI